MTLGDQAGRNNLNTATLTINVIRNQFTPYFINEPYSVVINENSGTLQNIYQVTARDDDAINTFERVTYQVTGDGSAPAFFRVDENTGSIFIRQSLANVAQTDYSLRITAYDNGIPARSNSTTVLITIDRNQNAPFFQPTQYSATIPDNAGLGSEVRQVTALDSDTVAPYNTVKYFLRSSASSEYFFIDEDTGIIYLRQSVALDQNSPSSYTLNVAAYDLGTPSRSAPQDATVFIQVTRNQNTPFFIGTPYIIQVQQTRAVGDVVLTVTANDQDQLSPFGDVTMRLIGDDDGVVYFGFNPLNGEISVNRDLTLDTASFYRLRIEARDGGTPSLSATALVEITVLRNLFDPEFTQQNYEVTIDETQSLGVNIVQLTAEDRDATSPHNVITYTLQGGFQNTLASSYFTVNSATGGVSLLQSLLNDASDTLRYTFFVTIADNGVPNRSGNNQATVIVNVIRNRFPPVFVNTPYNTNVDYTVSTGTSVYQVEATDQDVAPYNVVSYDLIGDDNGPVFFNIEANTGIIRASQNLVTESQTLYVVSSNLLNFTCLTQYAVMDSLKIAGSKLGSDLGEIAALGAKVLSESSLFAKVCIKESPVCKGLSKVKFPL